MTCCYCEPTLEEMLSDPIVEAVMEADAVDPRALDAMLSRIACELYVGRRDELSLGGIRSRAGGLTKQEVRQCSP